MVECDGKSSLHEVIINAITNARAEGVDDWHQHEHAFLAVMALNPELTAQAATRLINAVMEEQDRRGVCPLPEDYFHQKRDLRAESQSVEFSEAAPLGAA